VAVDAATGPIDESFRLARRMLARENTEEGRRRVSAPARYHFSMRFPRSCAGIGLFLALSLSVGCAREVSRVEVSPNLQAEGWSVELKETPSVDPSFYLDWPHVSKRLILHLQVTPPREGASLRALNVRMGVGSSREYSAFAFARQLSPSASWQAVRPRFAAVSAAGPIAGQGWSLVDDPSWNQWLLFQQRARQDVFVSFILPVGPGELVLRVF
jgi:hypothetical protein